MLANGYELPLAPLKGSRPYRGTAGEILKHHGLPVGQHSSSLRWENFTSERASLPRRLLPPGTRYACNNCHGLRLCVSTYLLCVQITRSQAFLQRPAYTGRHPPVYLHHMPACELHVIFVCCKWPHPNPREIMAISEGRTSQGGTTTRAYSVRGRDQVEMKFGPFGKQKH